MGKNCARVKYHGLSLLFKASGVPWGWPPCDSHAVWDGSCAAICFCQVVVFLETRRHRQQILAHQVSQAAAKEVLKKDKAARTTTMIIGALLLCYAPIILWPVVTTAGTPTHLCVHLWQLFSQSDYLLHENAGFSKSFKRTFRPRQAASWRPPSSRQNPQEKYFGGTIYRPLFFPKNAHALSQLFTMCACFFVTGCACKSNFADACGCSLYRLGAKISGVWYRLGC